MKLIIGNKNYSSWSFRPWIAMKVAGIVVHSLPVDALHLDRGKPV